METIASIENMDDVASSLAAGYEDAAGAARETEAELSRLQDSANAALCEAEQAVEEARAEVVRLETLVDSLERESASRHGEDDGTNSCVDELASAMEALGDEKEVLCGCEARRERAAKMAHRAMELHERFLSANRASLMRMQALGEACAVRVRHAREALEKYIAEHPGSTTATFADWIRWTPPTSAPVKPDVLASRIKGVNLREALAYEAGRDPRFRAKIEDYGRRWASAPTLAQKASVLRQARINGSGELAEKVVTAVFRPLGDVFTQTRTVFDDGRYTKTDLVVGNLHVPVILGRGDHAFAPKGGSLALEVKAGQASYLRSQRDHLVFQAGGHRSANAAATVCTADIHDLPEADERELRGCLRTAGSPILGMLPRKRDIDRALYEAIAYGIGKERP